MIAGDPASVKVAEVARIEPEFTVVLPEIVCDWLNVTDGVGDPVLAITIAALAPNVSVPNLLTTCAEVPLKVYVPAEAGENVRVAPKETAIFPFIECPGLPVRLIFKVPDVMVRLSQTNALVPVTDCVPDGIAHSKFAYVLPDMEGALLTSILKRLPV